MSQPFADNPLNSHADLQAIVRLLFAPLTRRFSPGAARVKLGFTGALFSDTAAELEGFSRPLWGIVPLVAGGGSFDHWDLYRRGLTNGSDPDHPEYWGRAIGRDQRLVEMAALGFALALVPQHVWEPLTAKAREQLVRWLLQINAVEVVDNNWLFFQVLVNLGLAQVGAEHDPVAMHRVLDRLETFYLDAGWYTDGPRPQLDYYIPFGMHFYGLLYAKLAASHDPQRAERFRDRAATFAQDFVHWFAADGAALPFGRSLTYRFAQGSFWGALAFADVEALPWGVTKGLALRHLRWWSQRPIYQPDGTLSIGYAYPNLLMAEQYNSPCSPYWAFKFFLPLALSPTHPFWQADEAPLPDMPTLHVQPHPGMILCRDWQGAHVVALSSGQHNMWARHGAEKYAKFAYSTAFGFSVPSGRYGLEQGAHDSMLAVSDDELHFRVREVPLVARTEQDMLYSSWQPWPDVEIETWLLPAWPWHIRVHHIRSGRKLWTAEGGWALDRTGDDAHETPMHISTGPAAALAMLPAGWSGVRDLQTERIGVVVHADPNTNILNPRTLIPTLTATREAGEYWLVCAVLGMPGSDLQDAQQIWDAPPAVPAFVPPPD